MVFSMCDFNRAEDRLAELVGVRSMNLQLKKLYGVGVPVHNEARNKRRLKDIATFSYLPTIGAAPERSLKTGCGIIAE